MQRQVEELALQVPERHVDRPHGVGRKPAFRAAAALRLPCLEHPPPHAPWLQRILTDHQLGQSTPADDRVDGLHRRAGGADPGDPVAGADLDQAQGRSRAAADANARDAGRAAGHGRASGAPLPSSSASRRSMPSTAIGRR